jgi:RNA methyltransferase, TrmH family
MNVADEFIRVPHSERVESLNAAIAASVILYEAQRQRRLDVRGAETQS